MPTTYAQTVTVPATDISQHPVREGDTEVSVTVMRSCTFLIIRRNGQVVMHADIDRGDWTAIAGIPAPHDTEQEDYS